tara:strand:+ start:349 stop:1182 length:834 start_codon:yes stop_codon:yes gene_type:complete
MVKPRRKRPMVEYLQDAYGISTRRACRVLPMHRSTYRYQYQPDPHTALRIRIRDLAESRVGWGYRRLRTLLLREGWSASKKLVYRLYREENLLLRPKKKRRRFRSKQRPSPPSAEYLNARWSMDFMADSLADGRRFRVLTIVDDFSRESLYIGALFRFTSQQVVDVLADLKTRRGAPEAIRVDNGPEFTSVALDQWAYWQQTTLIFSRPGQPTDNGLIEAFNARLRQEFLNAHWFVSLKEAQRKIEQWRQHYNQERPHSSLGDLTPSEFAQKHPNPG